MHTTSRLIWITGLIGALGCRGDQPETHTGLPPIEWPSYAGDDAATHWSTANDITPENVDRLRGVWTWQTGETGVADSSSGVTLKPGSFEATPLMVADTLYLSTPFNRVVALDATTGRQLWQHDPGARRMGLIGGDPFGFVHRGVAMWTGDGHRRVFIGSRNGLIALDAATGAPIDGFGDHGRVDLVAGLRWSVDPRQLGSTSPPMVWRDVVIVGNSVADLVMYPRDPPGTVQAFDVRTGRQLWRWDPVPPAGHPDRASWGGHSADSTGHVNVWAPMSVDAERGLLYLPVSAPSNDWYGGKRPGDDLYAESIVCLDAATGRMMWYHQLVHHGLWDYDLAATPLLATVGRGADSLAAVFVAGKTGFLYGFDRVTGTPLWPIPERAVPASDVPGEVASPTQPTPAWPLPFARQGFSLSDVVDFTPEIHRQALARLAGKRLGPEFTPPSREGTVVSPGWIGGAGWGSTAIDPIRRLLFVKSSNTAVLARLTPDPTRGYRIDSASYQPYLPLQLDLSPWRTWYGASRPGARVPINKPPYGTLTAFDLDSGVTRWQIVLGDTPTIREHPAVRALHLPPLGVSGPPGGVATRGGLIFITGGGATLYAIAAADGVVRWSAPLGDLAVSVPMTYRASNGVQYVVVAVGQGSHASLRAFALSR